KPTRKALRRSSDLLLDPVRFGNEVLEHSRRLAVVFPGGPGLVAHCIRVVRACRAPRCCVFETPASRGTAPRPHPLRRFHRWRCRSTCDPRPEKGEDAGCHQVMSDALAHTSANGERAKATSAPNAAARLATYRIRPKWRTADAAKKASALRCMDVSTD